MNKPVRAEGAALAIALLLMVILGLLAVTGMRLSIAELWMAGNEQYRMQASDAASAGIEATMSLLAARGPAATREAMGGGPSAAEPGTSGVFSVTLHSQGLETAFAGYSVDRFTAEHWEIDSTGEAARGARDQQIQGVIVVSPSANVRTFEQLGDGLDARGTP